MNILKKLSDSSLRVIYTFIALFCFVSISTLFVNVMFTERMTTDDCLWLYEYNNVKPDSGLFITEVIPGGVADEAGIKNGDILIAINGKTFDKMIEAQSILNIYGTGDVLTYTVIRDSKVLNLDINVYKHFNFLYLIFAILGLGFLLIGFLVGYSKPNEETSILFFFLGCSASLAFSNFGSVFLEYNFFVIATLIGEIFFYPIFVHFFLTYPIKRNFKSRDSFIKFLYSVPAFFIFSLLIINAFFRDKIIENNLFFLITILNIAVNLISVSYVISGIVIFISSYFRLKEEALKKPFTIILYGFIIGLIGFLYLYFIGFFIGKPAFLIHPWLFTPCALVLAIPFSFGYSIFKYRILDTEFIVKRSLVFGLLTSFIIALYLLFILVLDAILNQYVQENRQAITIALIVIVTFSFDFVNKKAKEFVDRQFYRERYNYRKSLLLFSEELPYLSNIKQILHRLKKSVEETMGVKNFQVWIKSEEYMDILTDDLRSGDEGLKKFHKPEAYDEAFTKLYQIDKEPKLLSAIYLAELDLNEDHKELLKEENFTLSVPIYVKGNLAGAMNFGEKPSGKAYSDEDIDLLKTLASQAAIAFENARLQKEQILKQKIEEELQIARRIQMGLLPSEINSIKGLEICGSYIPAKIIGGDFYDVIQISEKKLLVVVADVSGKGIPAALYMSKVQAMIQFAAKVFHSPKDILVEVNKQIYEKIERKSFITTVIALFDLEEMKVKICRAGHNPVIYSTNGKLQVLKNKGMGLGLEADRLFVDHLEETEIPIHDDSIFLFYSDGLTEAMNSNRDEYGAERVIEILHSHKSNSLNELRENILQSISSFRGEAEQNDDITFVLTKVKNQN